MTKLNIRKGDVPETLEEVDREIAKMAKQDARREAQRKGRLSEKKAQEAAANHEPGQPLSEDAAERAASGSGWQGEEGVLDGNFEVVTDPQVKSDLLEAEAQKKTVAPKPKAPRTSQGYRMSPTDHKEPTNKNGYAYLSPQIVERVFELKNQGRKNAEIATEVNISASSVSTVLSGPEWFRVRMTRYGGPGWEYPTRTPKAEESTEKGK